MGMHFIWQKINGLMCLLLTRLLSEGSLVIKCKTTKWVLTLVCVFLDLSSSQEACVCLSCCLASTFNGSSAIELCHFSMLRHQPAFSLCLSCVFFTFKTFYFNFFIIKYFKHAKKIKKYVCVLDFQVPATQTAQIKLTFKHPSGISFLGRPTYPPSSSGLFSFLPPQE